MNTIVVGAYWGDEGKGKIVDLLAIDSDWVVRYNGGDNAGHTIVAEGKKIVLHTLPSGVLQGKNVAIGPDVFFNPGSFLKDIKEVVSKGFTIKGRILIDERAHVIMPYHIVLDGIKDEIAKIGTTRRGIGPAAKDKADRTTDITVSDMVGSNFRQIIIDAVREKKEELLQKGILKSKYDVELYSEKVYAVYSRYAAKLKSYVGSVSYELYEQSSNGKSILIEGAQGTLLDVVHGTRPYITSSNTTAGGAASNLGIDLRKYNIIGIAKAYPTRVGEGLFPTELGEYEEAKTEDKNKSLLVSEKRKVADGDEKLLGRWIRLDGAEYGATTGRPRRCGHPDFVALKYCGIINAIDEWIITKIDVLSGKTFKAAIAYKNGGIRSERFPFKLEGWMPIYDKEYYWPKMSNLDIKKAISLGYDGLPEGMQQYIADLVQYTKIPVKMISLGPEREMTVIKDVAERTRGYLKKG